MNAKMKIVLAWLILAMLLSISLYVSVTQEILPYIHKNHSTKRIFITRTAPGPYPNPICTDLYEGPMGLRIGFDCYDSTNFRIWFFGAVEHEDIEDLSSGPVRLYVPAGISNAMLIKTLNNSYSEVCDVIQAGYYLTCLEEPE